MEIGEKATAHAAMENGAKHFEFHIATSESVAVSKEKKFTVKLNGHRFTVNNHAAFLFEIIK